MKTHKESLNTKKYVNIQVTEETLARLIKEANIHAIDIHPLDQTSKTFVWKSCLDSCFCEN
ncbi:MAG: hypothetical protein P1U80_04105 [Pseudomonadales bacterium]|jgi:hypothetical protein|nr:hypothetical protein [Pseudomonadales bacterium]